MTDQQGNHQQITTAVSVALSHGRIPFVSLHTYILSYYTYKLPFMPWQFVTFSLLFEVISVLSHT
jgi:hypothetical protein